jgi:hypothetical protein
MKLLLLFACLAAVPLKGITERHEALRHIQHIEIAFTTTAGCKHDDTGLNIQFKTAANDTIACKSGEFGKFDRNTTNAVDLDVQGEYFDKDLPNSIINLHITPNGNDNWNFDIDVTITWNDDTHSTYSLSGNSIIHNGTTDIEVSPF